MEPTKDYLHDHKFAKPVIDLSLKIKCESNSDCLYDTLSDGLNNPHNEYGNIENSSDKFDSFVQTLKMEVTCEEDEILDTKENKFVFNNLNCNKKKKKVTALINNKLALVGNNSFASKPPQTIIYSSDDDTPLSQYATQRNIHIYPLINEENTIKEEIVQSCDYKTSVIPKKYGVSEIKNSYEILSSKNEKKQRRQLRRERRLAKALRSKKLTGKINEKLKKKVYEYKKGKKIFCKSDSESSDFEKYVYFDESKTKRKIKLSPNISNEDIDKEIIDIKLENFCLMKEHARINQIKLKERLQLRLEIKRLKAIFMELKLEEYLKNQLTPQVGTTAGLINVLKTHLDTVDYSQASSDREQRLHQKLATVSFADATFWKDLNSIETSTDGINSIPFWVGNLEVIRPNVKKYYKPDMDSKNSADIKNGLINVENYSFTDFIWNSKTSKNDDARKTRRESFQTGSGIHHISKSHNEDTHYSESDINKADGNSSTTKNINKTDQRLYIDMNNDSIDNGVAVDTKNMEETSLDGDWQDEQTMDSLNSVNDNEHDITVLSNDLELHQKTIVNALTDEATLAAEEAGICIECGFNSSWSSFISRHRDAYQKSVKISPCHSCNMRFLKSGHFDGRHRLKRPPPKKFRSRIFMCDTCGQGCTSRSGLAQHILKHDEAKYSCPHCLYKCRRKAYIKIHIATHKKTLQNPANQQTGIVSQETTEVDNQLQNATSILNGDDLTADQKQLSKSMDYNCDECNHVCLTEKLLSEHKSSIHDFKVYTCDQCNYSTKKLSTLTQHLKTHAKEKPFQCSHCDYRSSCVSYLKSHERYHTEFKSFQCDRCQYSCVTATRMKVHRRKHAGERPHYCTECDYKCFTGHDLKIHMKTHLVGNNAGLHVDGSQNVERIS